jgi:hypothetical protein
VEKIVSTAYPEATEDWIDAGLTTDLVEETEASILEAAVVAVAHFADDCESKALFAALTVFVSAVFSAASARFLASVEEMPEASDERIEESSVEPPSTALLAESAPEVREESRSERTCLIVATAESTDEENLTFSVSGKFASAAISAFAAAAAASIFPNAEDLADASEAVKANIAAEAEATAADLFGFTTDESSEAFLVPTSFGVAFIVDRMAESLAPKAAEISANDALMVLEKLERSEEMTIFTTRDT